MHEERVQVNRSWQYSRATLQARYHHPRHHARKQCATALEQAKYFHFINFTKLDLQVADKGIDVHRVVDRHMT